MLKVALTGGIATGKSYVLSRLRERDVPCIDADDIVHDTLGRGNADAPGASRAQFGSAFLNADGSVNRTHLGAKVFSDPDSRLQLEAIIHPVVYETIRDGMRRSIDRSASRRFRSSTKPAARGISTSSR